MVIDTSVIVAIAMQEPEADRLEEIIDAARVRLVSVASVLEAAIVLQTRFGKGGSQMLDSLLARLPIDVVAIDVMQLRWARYALENYGRGQHAARLNFGDCFSYALAKSTGEPLLFKGGDFAHTDIAIA